MFEEFPKIPRLFRDCTITEKIDGTNAQVAIYHSKDPDKPTQNPLAVWCVGEGEMILYMFAGSRKRWIAIGDDNFGFANWVQENSADLFDLGPGRHYGEWWGQGIQRKYGLDHKRFSLINTKRWGDERPECCHVVPIIYEGPFYMDAVTEAAHTLEVEGSMAAPGFMQPEGVIIFHHHANLCFKYTPFDGNGHKHEHDRKK